MSPPLTLAAALRRDRSAHTLRTTAPPPMFGLPRGAGGGRGGGRGGRRGGDRQKEDALLGTDQIKRTAAESAPHAMLRRPRQANETILVKFPLIAYIDHMLDFGTTSCLPTNWTRPEVKHYAVTQE
jgi:hypothetical protein